VKEDFPGVSCDACKVAFVEDREIPACIEGDCLVPELDEKCSRVMSLRAQLINLSGLVDPATILKMHDAEIEDIELLEAVEAEIRALKEDKGKDG
jgi:hypothetical protein